MPKLLFVVACEKVIFDQAGPFSLISVFQKVNIQLQDAPLPENAISPMRWHSFCLWENDPKEIGQTFTQVTRVFAPDGSVFAESEGDFVNNEGGDSQAKVNVMYGGIPISREGDIVIRVWIKGAEDSVGEYKFGVFYLPK